MDGQMHEWNDIFMDRFMKGRSGEKSLKKQNFFGIFSQVPWLGTVDIENLLVL